MRPLIVLSAALLLFGCASSKEQVSALGSQVSALGSKVAQATSTLSSSALSSNDEFSALSSMMRPARARVRDDYRFPGSQRATQVPGVGYFCYRPKGRDEITGFALRNSGSPSINPAGLSKPGSHRDYSFFFADRAWEEIHLSVVDDVNLSGNFSHDVMLREWHFFPRRHLPAMSRTAGGSQFKVTLSTGESVRFDARTKEVIGGVLKEQPIDFNPSRHARHAPRVRYQGDYLGITVAIRGESPRREQLWGQTNVAEVHYPSKYSEPCRLSPKYFWDQTPKPGDTDPTLLWLHEDEDALFGVIERQCGWDLSALRLASAR